MQGTHPDKYLLGSVFPRICFKEEENHTVVRYRGISLFRLPLMFDEVRELVLKLGTSSIPYEDEGVICIQGWGEWTDLGLVVLGAMLKMSRPDWDTEKIRDFLLEFDMDYLRNVAAKARWFMELGDVVGARLYVLEQLLGGRNPLWSR